MNISEIAHASVNEQRITGNEFRSKDMEVLSVRGRCAVHIGVGQAISRLVRDRERTYLELERLYTSARVHRDDECYKVIKSN